MGFALSPKLSPATMLFTGVFMFYTVFYKQWFSISTIAVASIALSFVWMVWNWHLWPKMFSPLRRLPGPDDGHWILGQIFHIIEADPGVTMLRWMHTIPNKGIIRYLGILNQERLLLTSPQALADVLVNHQDDFQMPALMHAPMKRLIGDGLILAEGNEHKQQRRLLDPAFSFRHIKNLYPVFWSKACESVEAMTSQVLLSSKPALPFIASLGNVSAERLDTAQAETESILDVDEWAFRVTLDIVGLGGLGHDFDCVRDPEITLAKINHEVSKSLGRLQVLDLLYLLLPGSVVDLVPTTRNFVSARASRVIKEICHDIVREKRAKIAKEKSLNTDSKIDDDVTSTLLQNKGLDDDAVVAQMMTLLSAGQDPPAAALTWAVYLLCLYPGVQSRLRAEVRANLPSPSDMGKTIVAADIDSLPYLAAVCSEVLRFMAPVPNTIREAVNDSTIAGEFVPKGTCIMICLWAMNKNVALWGEDADRFDPDRWLTTVTCPETDQSSVRKSKSGGATSNYAFMSFSQGRKQCIGQKFVLAELACIVANWVGRFELTLNDPVDATELVINRGGAVMRPAKGLFVKARVVPGW